jgi:AhpD family alkylhydroperoxidase
MTKNTPVLTPRMNVPQVVGAEAMVALQAVGKIGTIDGTPSRVVALAQIRASQINGCSVCVAGSSRLLKDLGETDDRIFAISAWRDSPYFTEAERAALALSEAMTRLSDRSDPVPDAVWQEAARHFPAAELAALVMGVAVINLYNRINVTTRQVGAHWEPKGGASAK